MIVQFVPDALTEERINVGVIVFDEQAVECHFLSNWSRVRCFAGEEIEFLRDFAHDTTKALSGTSALDLGAGKDMGRGRAFTPDLLNRISKEWAGAIQLTPPKSSPRSRTSVLEWATNRFLVDPHAPKTLKSITDSKMRNNVLRIVQRQARRFLLPESAESMIHTDYVWRGKLEEHIFKVALANGHSLAGFDAISMNNPARGIVQASRIKWALSDIRQQDKETPLVVAVHPPKEDLGEYRTLLKTIRDLRGEAVPEDEAEGRIAEIFAQVVPSSQKRPIDAPQIRLP